MAAVLPLPDERDRKILGVPDGPEDAPLGEAPNFRVVDNADGSADVFDPEEEGKAETGHLDNLAETLPEEEMTDLSSKLMERIEYDKEARRQRDEKYAEGIKRTGMGDEAPGGATFAGASRAVHPMLAEAAVDFAASAMRELFPPDGPVRTEIFGETTDEKLELANRQYECMNWQLTEQIEEFPEELEQLLTQLPLGGSMYFKFWPDETEGRTCCEFVPVDDILLPYACSSFWSSPRITHVQRITQAIWDDRIETGMYRDVDSGENTSAAPEQTKAAEASEKVEGKTPEILNLDGLRIVYEVNTYCKLSVDGDKRLPYLVSICERTGKVCAIYRNWEEDDKRCKRLHWIADFGFIPWRGAYKAGLPHLIGSLAGAATGALRALLDSALISTLPVLLKLKGTKFSGQSKTIDPTQAMEIEAGGAIDDIRKLVTNIPFAGPNLTLFQLLGWLTDAGKGVVTTAEEKIAEAGNQMPVGTALALIEQGAKVFSSIHARLHRSMKKCLKIIARINATHLTEQVQLDQVGEVLALAADFKQPLAVVPVSDPNIFSEGQRYAQMHLVQAFAEKYPQLHNLYEMLHYSYKQAKIQEIDKLLPPPPQPSELNAAAENSAVMLGRPINAFPKQNHLAHLETHMRFIIDPMFGGNPAAVPQTWPKMIEHIKQHLAFQYAKTMFDIASEALHMPLDEALKDQKNWPKIDQVLAAASKVVHDKLAQLLEPLGPTINQMIQQIEKMKPPPPMDPSAAALKIAAQDDERKKKEHQDNLGLAQAELQEKAQKDQGELALKGRKVEIDAADALHGHLRAAGEHSDRHALDIAHLGNELISATMQPPIDQAPPDGETS